MYLWDADSPERRRDERGNDERSENGRLVF
jgi:hypothetical protein